MAITRYVSLFIFLVLPFSAIQAGTLDDLEENATKPVEKSSNKKQRYRKSEPNSLEAAAAEAIFRVSLKMIEFGTKMMIIGGENSQERFDSDSPIIEDDKRVGLFRKKGDPILPVFSFTSHWLSGNNSVDARLNRVELGYGAVAMSYSQNILKEPNDKLTLTNTLFHYRMSIGNDFSWDLAWGRGKMNGNQSHDGDVFAMPMRIRIHERTHLEYYPIWSSYNGGSLAEHQFNINWRYKYIGLTAGYKKWSAGPTTVRGLFTGFNVSF